MLCPGILDGDCLGVGCPRLLTGDSVLELRVGGASGISTRGTATVCFPTSASCRVLSDASRFPSSFWAERFLLGVGHLGDVADPLSILGATADFFPASTIGDFVLDGGDLVRPVGDDVSLVEDLALLCTGDAILDGDFGVGDFVGFPRLLTGDFVVDF